jgi:hypothetical protein
MAKTEKVKQSNWALDDYSLKELVGKKYLVESKTYESWIENYHKGIPSYRIEIDYPSGYPVRNLLKFNIFCFHPEILKKITPKGCSLPAGNDWDNLKSDKKINDVLFTFTDSACRAHHRKYIFFDYDGFWSPKRNFEILEKPSSSFFIDDPEMTKGINIGNIIFDNINIFHKVRLFDLAGYPRFMIRWIR